MNCSRLVPAFTEGYETAELIAARELIQQLASVDC